MGLPATMSLIGMTTGPVVICDGEVRVGALSEVAERVGGTVAALDQIPHDDPRADRDILQRLTHAPSFPHPQPGIVTSSAAYVAGGHTSGWG